MLKSVVMFALLFFPALLPAQSSADSATNVPALVGRNNYGERSTFSGGNFRHEVWYDDPNENDEEFSYILEFRFASFDSIRDRHTYDLSKDTAAVHALFCINDYLHRGDYPSQASITGTITILGKSENAVVIEEDVRIVDRKGNVYIYQASRSFSCRKPKN